MAHGGHQVMWLLVLGAVIMFGSWVWAETWTHSLSLPSSGDRVKPVSEPVVEVVVDDGIHCPSCAAPFRARDDEFWAHMRLCMLIELGLSGGFPVDAGAGRVMTAAEAIDYDALHQQLLNEKVRRWRELRRAWEEGDHQLPPPVPPWFE